jgi:hypothetical protein
MGGYTGLTSVIFFGGAMLPPTRIGALLVWLEVVALAAVARSG